MPEPIYKLQPDRTLALRGFDSFAAAATIHSASPTGFKVSGTFRDPADFAVAVLYDADNFYEHPSIRYLPDFDFRNLTLSFKLHYSDGLQPIDSPKYNWIDWATLDCVTTDAPPTKVKVRLWDYATLASSTFPAASSTVNVTTDSHVRPYDRITLWFQNLVFDYVVPGEHPRSTGFLFFAGTTGTAHSITINGRTYTHTEAAGEDATRQASALIDAIRTAADPDVEATAGADGNVVILTVRTGREGIEIPLSASDGNASVTLFSSSPTLVAAGLAAQINVADWNTANTTHALLASSTGPALTVTAARYGTADVAGTSVTLAGGARFTGITAGSPILIANVPHTVASVESPTHLTVGETAADGSGLTWVAPRGGRDGNMIQLYALTTPPTCTLDQTTIQLSGGSSDVSWNCVVDFTARGIDHLRQCWLTFAPSVANGTPFTATEWQATFSDWTLTALPGSTTALALKVAGPGSVRIEQGDSACAYHGAWTTESGFYSKYFAQATSDVTASLTVTYYCQFTHDLYLGTSLDSDRAVLNVQLDGGATTTLDCSLSTSSAVVTRRLARATVAAGKHTVTFTLHSAGVFYFNFLEAAVLSNVPDALEARTNISPALDFDTDHTYKLPPARLMWIMDRLGYAGPMNEYLGVFWWNERVASGGSVSHGRIAFSGTFAAGEQIHITVNDTVLKKNVYGGDTLASIALHFAAWINETSVGAWATATIGGELTITSRSPSPDYNLTLTRDVISAAGHVEITATPVAGDYAGRSWVIDDTATQPLNRAARDWHADFYAQCASRGREVVTACSLELVNPPDGYTARFADSAHTPVTTATGFGTLASNHCAVGSTRLLAFQKTVYRAIAQLQTDAGLTPAVQYGECLWWYFPQAGGGMAYYDDETMAAAEVALGRPLHVFDYPNDDPSVNGGADALFLRNRLRDYVAALIADIRTAHPTVKCELLWPYDVDYPTPVPNESPYLGGQLNRFINLPVEWQTQSSSGFDRVKVEALAFATGMRNLDLAREAIELFPNFGWPRDSIRYLVPVFGSATPWARELALVWGAGIPYANLWAFDHICLFNLDVPERPLDRRSVVLAG